MTIGDVGITDNRTSPIVNRESVSVFLFPDFPIVPDVDAAAVIFPFFLSLFFLKLFHVPVADEHVAHGEAALRVKRPFAALQVDGGFEVVGDVQASERQFRPANESHAEGVFETVGVFEVGRFV